MVSFSTRRWMLKTPADVSQPGRPVEVRAMRTGVWPSQATTTCWAP